ncbi:hypothetical protein KIW84_051153 [Lathyrus oleraceus]|uniref:Uncharacterized protein n=1 Tax=Pisum sativum TaxID=3888 RepID=A0A9D5ADH9_PEA|nr:hypothetical protein KIW84_051153 [Pisum sativum]
MGCEGDKGTFDNAATEDILHVPLVVEDKMIWKNEQNGIYNVRSGYRLWRSSQLKNLNGKVEGDWCSLRNIKASPATNQCWRAASLSNIIDPQLTPFNDVKSIIFDIFSREDKKVTGRVAVMIDVIWRNRNGELWNNEHEEATKLGMVGLGKWQDGFSSQLEQESENLNHHLTKWSAPNVGWLKCNVDASLV